MKTGVSIPDPLFKAADQLASRLRVSRSELYAQALERYLAGESDDAITTRLDELYASEGSAVEAPIAAAQRRAIAE
jgi:metal-responsive CopG/Arc/MetJ family transcriptional regulator